MNEPEALIWAGPNKVRLHGRTLLYFSGCDYFRLAQDPRLVTAAVKALKRHGLNVAASRKTTGNHHIYSELETALAKFFKAPAATVLPDGYYAPLAVAQALAGEATYVFVDELAHGALIDAARLFKCPVKTFKHRNPVDLQARLKRLGPTVRPIVLTDGLFAHDGSVAPLRQYLRILPQHGRLLVDDAHGVGILGDNGRGTVELEGVNSERIIQCGTLSKAFGAYGGFVLGPRALRQKIWARSWVFIGTTPLPPPLARAALASLKILRHGKGKRQQLFRNCDYVRECLRNAGWEITKTPGPIIRLPAMSAAAANRLKAQLLAAGIYPPYLKYAGASAQGVFRLVISSEHTRAELDQLLTVLKRFKR